MSTKVLSVINEKGGCGKTTTVIQIAYYLAQSKKVLLIDLDKQASSTIHLTGRANHKISSYDILKSECELPIKKSVVRADNSWGNLLLIPADRRLTTIEQDLAGSLDRDRILRKVIQDTKDFFDYIVIDTPPVLGVETRNALIASTHYLVVTDLSEYSEIGVSNARVFADKVKKRVNKKLKEVGVLLTGYEKANANVVREVMKNLREEDFFLKDWVIPHSVKVLEAQRNNKALGDVFPSSIVAKVYKRFADHLTETL